MTKFEEMKPNDSASLIRRIEALERQVQQAGAARRLESATIGRGGVVVQGGAIILRDADGHEIARMGIREDILPEPDGDPQPGFILRRNDGSIAFTLDDPDPSVDGYRQLLKMHDADGNIIFMEDYKGGWGLSSPTFAAPLYPAKTVDWPFTTTASPAWETLWTGWFPCWNPVVTVGMYSWADAATTGNVRLTVNGLQQGTPLSAVNAIVDSVNTNVDISTVVGGAPGSFVQISIEAQRLTGTGKVYSSPIWAIGAGTGAL